MQKFEPRKVVLKTGKTVVIRQANLSDAEGLLHCIKAYIAQSEYIPKLESEITLNIEQESEWINSFLKYENSILLIAEFNNEIIGNIDVTGSRRKIMEHTAMIGMGMLKEWRNSGLGTQLLSCVVEWAMQNPILELIWLQVYADNVLGMSLYKKIGFQENGMIKRFFKRNDTYFDNVTMTLDVGQLKPQLIKGS